VSALASSQDRTVERKDHTDGVSGAVDAVSSLFSVHPAASGPLALDLVHPDGTLHADAAASGIQRIQVSTHITGQHAAFSVQDIEKEKMTHHFSYFQSVFNFLIDFQSKN
jgi:hypothetical protein